MKRALLATTLAGLLAACTTVDSQQSVSDLQRRVRKLEDTTAPAERVNTVETDLADLRLAFGESRIINGAGAIARIDSAISSLRAQNDTLSTDLSLERDIRSTSISAVSSAAQLQAGLDRRHNNALQAAYTDAAALLSVGTVADVTTSLATLRAQTDTLEQNYHKIGNMISQYRASVVRHAPDELKKNPAVYHAQVNQSYDLVRRWVASYGTDTPVNPAAFATALAEIRKYDLTLADQATRTERNIYGDMDDSLLELYQTLDAQIRDETVARVGSDTETRAYADRKVAEGTTPLATRADALEGRATHVEGRTTLLEGRATQVETRTTQVEGRASALEGSVADIGSRVGTIQRAPPPGPGQTPPALPTPDVPLTPEQRYLRGDINLDQYNRLRKEGH